MISDASPMHMARDLVVRHSDIGFIRGYIINYFGKAPPREKIEALRAEHVAALAASNVRIVQSDEHRRERARRRDNERNAAKRASRAA